MKTTTLIAIGAASLFSTAHLNAGDAIEIDQLPQAVTESIEDYFPGAELLRAEMETKRRVQFYEVKLQYKDLRLEVEVAADGRMLEVETDD